MSKQNEQKALFLTLVISSVIMMVIAVWIIAQDNTGNTLGIPTEALGMTLLIVAISAVIGSLFVSKNHLQPKENSKTTHAYRRYPAFPALVMALMPIALILDRSESTDIFWGLSASSAWAATVATQVLLLITYISLLVIKKEQ